MVTDRVGPTITTLKAEVDYLDGEVKKLLNLLADARTESMKLRAALGYYACKCKNPQTGCAVEFDRSGNARCGYEARAALEGK